MGDDEITLDVYAQFVLDTAIKLPNASDRLLKGALGLSSESGEFAGLVEKWMYQDHKPQPFKMKKELGDVLWYLVYTCQQLDWSLEEVMQYNYEKLSARYPDGVFKTEDSIKRVDICPNSE